MSAEIWSVWPTVSPDRSAPMIARWHERGYKVGVLVNPPHAHTDLPDADRVIVQDKWISFPCAVNILCAEVSGDVVAIVGDDVYPDEHHTAQEIGEQFRERFPDLMGVMQPTGDHYACDYRCCVSPWVGRKFINEAYGGHGPYWMGYYHYFSDEELQLYATQLGCFQQREDLTQFHDHWQRQEQPKRPRHLRRAKMQHAKDKDIFRKRKAAGFPS